MKRPVTTNASTRSTEQIGPLTTHMPMANRFLDIFMTNESIAHRLTH